MTGIGSNVTGIGSDVTGIGSDVTGIGSDVTGDYRLKLYGANLISSKFFISLQYTAKY